MSSTLYLHHGRNEVERGLLSSLSEDLKLLREPERLLSQKVTLLDNMLTSITSSSAFDDGEAVSKWKAAVLTMLEEGMDIVVRAFQSFLRIQDWLNFYTITRDNLVWEGEGMPNEAQVQFLVNRGPLQEGQRSPLNITALMSLLCVHADNLEEMARGENSDETSEAASLFFFRYALFLLMKTAKQASDKFVAEWEVRFFGQVVPHTGSRAVLERPVPSRVVNDEGFVQEDDGQADGGQEMGDSGERDRGEQNLADDGEPTRSSMSEPGTVSVKKAGRVRKAWERMAAKIAKWRFEHNARKRGV